MSTLLLRLAAPLQSWGSDSKFETRYTEKEPTKSGIVGMLAAALGRKRNEDLSDLNALRFGLRVDQEGVLLRDYQTVHSQKGKKVSNYVTERYYLSDAAFLVGLEGEQGILEQLSEALQSPVYPLFLGRRSCPPTLPLVLGIRENNLEYTLQNEPMLAKTNHAVRMQCETKNGNIQSRRHDVAISFNPAHRKYGYRMLEEQYLNCCITDETEHDVMAELE